MQTYSQYLRKHRLLYWLKCDLIALNKSDILSNPGMYLYLYSILSKTGMHSLQIKLEQFAVVGFVVTTAYICCNHSSLK